MTANSDTALLSLALGNKDPKPSQSVIDPTAVSWSIVMDRRETAWKDAELLLRKFLKLKATYKCYAEHIGKKTEFKHYHAYVHFPNSRKRSDMVRAFGENVRIMNSGDQTCRSYIRDQAEESFVEFGKPQETRSEKKDSLLELLDAGHTWETLLRDRSETALANSHKRAFIDDYVDMRKKQQFIKDYRQPEWRPWQQHLLDVLAGPVHPRHIVWYYNPEGDAGKSEIWLWASIQSDILIMNCWGTDKDLTGSFNERGRGKYIRSIMIDIPAENIPKINYGFLEIMKNGVVITEKYHSTVQYNPRPHIICLSNDKPDVTRMVTNRWDIFTIMRGEIVEHLIQ